MPKVTIGAQSRLFWGRATHLPRGMTIVVELVARAGICSLQYRRTDDTFALDVPQKALPPCLALCVALSLLRIATFFSSENDGSARELSDATSPRSGGKKLRKLLEFFALSPIIFSVPISRPFTGTKIREKLIKRSTVGDKTAFLFLLECKCKRRVRQT